MCTRCSRELPDDSFTGRHRRCKECRAEEARANFIPRERRAFIAVTPEERALVLELRSMVRDMELERDVQRLANVPSTWALMIRAAENRAGMPVNAVAASRLAGRVLHVSDEPMGDDELPIPENLAPPLLRCSACGHTLDYVGEAMDLRYAACPRCATGVMDLSEESVR